MTIPLYPEYMAEKSISGSITIQSYWPLGPAMYPSRLDATEYRSCGTCLPHSARKAIKGSTRAARRAGRYAAIRAAAESVTTPSDTATGSYGPI